LKLEDYKISVIVTTYNRKEFLKETLYSIIEQSFKPYEVLVIDNYSNYDIEECINSIDKSIKLFKNHNNGIISTNRNLGIKKSKGDLLAFCDDDDIWEKNKLEIQLKKLIETGSDVIHSYINEFSESKISLKSYKPMSYQTIFFRNPVCLSTVMLKKTPDIFFNEEKSKFAIEDYSLWINLMFKNYKFYLIKKPLIKYRIISSSASFENRNLIEYNKIKLFREIITNHLVPKKQIYLAIILQFRIIKSFIKIKCLIK